MTRAADLARSVAARHRLRRPPRPPLGLALAPPARRISVVRVDRRAIAATTRLALVLAPRIAIAAGRDGATAAAAPAPREPRVAATALLRLVERVQRTVVRRDGVAPAAPVATPADPIPRGAPAAPAAALARRARSAGLVLARPPAARVPEPAATAAVTAHGIAQPGPGRRTPDLAPSPTPAPELARITEHVLASLDRRIVAERERRGHV